jgi:predicted dehydrogenase
VLKAGIVGCGFMGRMHANVYSGVPGVKLTACVDYKSERGKKFADEFGLTLYHSLAEMAEAENLDIADICVPTHMHRDYTIEALELNLNTLCEKPMALNLTDADAMIEAAQRSKGKFMVAHCIRFWPEYVIVKDLVDSKRLGRLLSINLTRYGAFPAWTSDGWSADESKSGGGVLDMHIHDTDFALFLLGEPETMVSHGSVDGRGPGHAFTTMTFDSGRTVAHMEGGWNLPSNAPFKMALRAIFEKGCAIMDAGPLTIYEEGKEPEVPEIAKMAADGGGNLSDLGGYFHEIKYFVDCIAESRPIATATAESARRSLDYTLREIRQIKEKIGGP